MSRTTRTTPPLHHAAWHGHTECLLLLLSQGADPESRNSKGRTAREIALGQGHADCVDRMDAQSAREALGDLWARRTEAGP